MQIVGWTGLVTVPSHEYFCGYCQTLLSSASGYNGRILLSPGSGPVERALIYICHKCYRPTFFDPTSHTQTPGVAFGDSVSNITDKDVASLYEEARQCMKASAYTAAVLSSRKLLMHIAVSKGASADQTFAAYVKYLIEQHYVPPGSEQWVDHIRKKGNEANHEIRIMSKEEAEILITFSGMLLKLLYEFPVKLQTAINPPQSATGGVGGGSMPKLPIG